MSARASGISLLCLLLTGCSGTVGDPSPETACLQRINAAESTVGEIIPGDNDGNLERLRRLDAALGSLDRTGCSAETLANIEIVRTGITRLQSDANRIRGANDERARLEIARQADRTNRSIETALEGINREMRSRRMEEGL
jgi:hypothetical protein